MKDSINSYEQKSWEHTINHYARLQAWLKLSTTPYTIEYITKLIKEYEDKYPQLKKFQLR